MLSSLIDFFYVAVLMALVPGAAVAMVLQLSGRVGKKAACGAVLGIVFALAIWGGAASFGMGALLRRYPDASLWLLRAGCVYLGYLGFKTFLESLSPQNLDVSSSQDSTQSDPAFWPHVWKALSVMVLNPEIGMYDAALYPKFIQSGDSMLLMGLLFTLIEMLVIGGWYFALSLALSSCKVWRNPNVLVWADRIFGALLLFLAFRGWK